MSSSIVVHSCTMLHPPTVTRFKSGLLCLYFVSSIVSVGVHTFIGEASNHLGRSNPPKSAQPFVSHAFLNTCIYIYSNVVYILCLYNLYTFHIYIQMDVLYIDHFSIYIYIICFTLLCFLTYAHSQKTTFILHKCMQPYL